MASGNGLAGSCYGGSLKGRRKRRDDGGMSTIVFIRNPRSAVDPAVLRTTSKARDFGEGGNPFKAFKPN